MLLRRPAVIISFDQHKISHSFITSLNGEDLFRQKFIWIKKTDARFRTLKTRGVRRRAHDPQMARPD
jgi:hypothetical protein